jgi:hypothetical protein
MRGVRNTSLSVTCRKGFVFSRLQRHPHLGSQDQCAACGRQTSVTASTIMHASKLPLPPASGRCFWGPRFPTASRPLQLQSLLGLGSYQPTWMQCTKLRRAIVDPDREP